MKKSIIGIMAACAAGAAVTIAGCGSTQEAVETTTAETMGTETTSATTASSETTSETTSSTATETTATAASLSKYYDVTVNKILDGFSKSGDFEYKSGNASYKYIVLDNVTEHAMEASLDGTSTKISNAQEGVANKDVYYILGEKDGKNYIKAYKYAGTADDLNTYIGVEYSSGNSAVKDEAVTLLSNDYITWKAK